MIKIKDNARGRIFNILLYPDNIEHLQAIYNLRNNGYDYVGIKHDKDIYFEDKLNDDLSIKHAKGELKKEHFHFVVKFKNARYISAVAKELDIDDRFIEICKNFKNSTAYLLHIGYEDKYQYSNDELEGNLIPEVLKLIDDTCEDCKFISLLDLLDSFDTVVSKTQFARICVLNGLYSVFRRNSYYVLGCLQEHNEMIKLREGSM